MQNPSGNPNQQMYYQPQQQSQGGAQMGMAYQPNMAEQQQRQQQMNQSMMGMQGGVMNAQQPNPSNLPNQQMYAATNQHMQNVPQQRTFPSRLPQNQQSQSQMYASPSSSTSNVNAVQSYQQNESQSQNAMLTQQQQQQYTQQQQNIPQSTSFQQLPPQRIAEVRKEEPKNVRPLNPPPYSPEILNNLSKYSVWSLSMIGRELVQELILRTQMLMNLLFKLIDRRYQQQSTSDPEQLLEYCQMILTRIVEIRLRIDRVTAHQKHISEDDFIAMMSDPSTPQKPPQQVQKEQIFEAQRHKLVKLSSALKSFEWMCSVSDPRLLKKPEKL